MSKKIKPNLPLVDEELYKPSSGKDSLINLAIALAMIAIGFVATFFSTNSPL